jgi:putative ABC transport system ATP-binding protein
MDKNIYSFIWRYSKRQQIVITLITFASFPFLYSALELPKIIVNDALRSGPAAFPKPLPLIGVELDQVSYLLSLCAVLLVLLMANAFFLMSTNTYKNLTSERMTRRLRYMLYQRILRFPLPHFQRVSQGELSTMIAGEVELIRDFIADAIALPVYQGGTLLVIVTFMFVQDPLLGAASLALIPVQAYVIPKLQRKINLMNRERVERARKLSGRVGESVSGIRDIRVNNTALFSQADFSKHLEGIYKVRYRLFKTKYFMKALNVFLLKLTPLMFYSVGGVLIIYNRLTVGALVAALAAYANLTTPWKELLKYYQRKGDASIKYYQLVSSFELGSLLNDKVLAADDSRAEDVAGSIEFDKLTVADEDGSRPLDSVSFTVEPGGKLAIVAGAVGRDRLAQTVTRLSPATSGQVRIGGRPLSSYSDKTLGMRIGYAGADSYIFEGSIGYNSIYGLLQDMPKEQGSYDVPEAVASGNCPYDSDQDWTDLSAIGCGGTEDLEDWWFHVVQAVELDSVVFQHALNQEIDEVQAPHLPEKILDARARIVKRLKSNPALRQLVRPFEFDSYNKSATVATNIMFGRPMDERLSPENFGANPYVRETLKKVGLDDEFQKIGFEVAKELVDIFGDQEAEAGLTDRFSFVDNATLERLSAILARAEETHEDLNEADRAEMVGLVARMSVERHRLGKIDEDMQAKIVEARKVFHLNIPEALKSGIAVYDPAVFNPHISIRGNLVMGRSNQERPNAEQKVNEVIREVVTEMGIFKDVILAGRDAQVGIGGQRLTTAARQSLALARCLIKKPSILIINDALSGHGREAIDRIRQNIYQLLPDTTVMWIGSEIPKVTDFDEVLVLRDGRIDKRIVEATEQVMEAVVEAEEVAETPTSISAEAAALAKVPIFKDIRSSNLKLLAFGSKRVTFDSGETLFHQGDQGNCAYVILRGEVDILLDDGTPNERQVARLGRHQPVGEIALLATVPRTAGAKAFSKVEALEIEKEAFLQIIENDPKVASNVARIASERLATTMVGMQQKAA